MRRTGIVYAACLTVGLGCNRGSKATAPPPPPGPAWPVTVTGVGAVAAGSLVVADQGVVVAGYAERGTTVRGRILSEVPGAYVLALADDGTARWVRTLEGRANVRIDGLWLTPEGDVLFSGFFAGVARSGRYKLQSHGMTDCLIGRIDASGTLQWLQQLGGPGVDQCRRITARGEHAWVTGASSGDWVGGNLGQTLGSLDAFVFRVDARTGAPAGGLQFGTVGEDMGRDVAATEEGQVVVVGTIAGPFSPEGELLHPPEALHMQLADGLVLQPTRDSDGFVVSFDNEGIASWAIPVATDGYDVVKRIVRDDDGWWIAGSIQPNAPADGRPGLAEGAPPLQGFVTRLSTDGVVQWTWSPTAVSSVTDLAEAGESLVAVGHFSGELEIGERRWASQGDSSGVFVSRLNGQGQATEGWVCDGPAMDYGWGVGVAADGEVFFAGETGWPSTCAPQGTGRLGFVARTGG